MHISKALAVAKAAKSPKRATRRKRQLRTLRKIEKALEKAGVEFIPENGGGAGVRLAKRTKGK